MCGCFVQVVIHRRGANRARYPQEGIGLWLIVFAPITMRSMTVISGRNALDQLIVDQDGVLGTASALQHMTKGELYWRVSSGRWQRPCNGVIVAHSGPLTESQVLRVTWLSGGRNAALAGLTAAWLGGFTGFGDKNPIPDKTIFLVVPVSHKKRIELPWPNIEIRYSRALTEKDVYVNLEPRRTKMARSLIDAAAWMPTDRGAMAVLAAGVQQRKTRVPDLRETLDRCKWVRRRALMREILCDIEGGAQALSELDFYRAVIRQFGLPQPSGQAGRRDSRGKQRWIDVMFEEWNVVVEIDGAQHTQPLEQWDDMDRDNDLNIDGYRVLRFPAWLVRRNPERVARKILEALRRAGYQG